MKYIIIGLGNFGSALSVRLTALGHEVIGVDNSMQKVDAYKDKITHTICMDCTDEQAIGTLPLKDTDVVIVAIGEDIASSLMATATLKQLKVKRLISRSISHLHRTVVEAIGVDQIISPEEESAERLAKKLQLQGVVDSFYLSGEYNIIEARVPKPYWGSTIAECGFRTKYNVNIVTIIRMPEEKNSSETFTKEKGKVMGVLNPQTVLESNDILVLFGNINDIERLLEK